MGMFEHLYKNSRRYYTDFIALGDIYAVCWYSDLLDIVDSGSSKKSDTMDKKIYELWQMINIVQQGSSWFRSFGKQKIYLRLNAKKTA